LLEVFENYFSLLELVLKIPPPWFLDFFAPLLWEIRAGFEFTLLFYFSSMACKLFSEFNVSFVLDLLKVIALYSLEFYPDTAYKFIFTTPDDKCKLFK